MYRGYRLFLPSTLLLRSALCLRKRSHRQQLEIANIHISAEPSLDLSSNILGFFICLQFLPFNLSLPPSHPALLLLAVRVVVLGISSLPPIKTWQRLPIFVHTPTVASLSAFGRTALKVKERTRWSEGRPVGGGGKAECTNPVEYEALWITGHFSQWSRKA